MTTVAVKDGIVAFDGRITASSEVYPGLAQKAWISKKHQTIFAACGAVTLWHDAIRFIERGKKLPWQVPAWNNKGFPDLGDNTWVMAVSRDGHIHIIESSTWYPCVTQSTAIGSGSMAANAAMMCGKSAVEAVEIAIQLDTGSGPPVNILRLEDIPQPVRRARRRRRR